jgi:hypothetical protein
MASPFFRNYERTMRRIYWLEFVDEQLEAAHRLQFRTSLVQPAAGIDIQSNADRKRRPDRRR